MKTPLRIIAMIWCMLVSVVACAQDLHFIYIQSELKNPFYVKLDNKVLPASGKGYMIIPKLEAGDYKLKIGFPQDAWPEQEINVKVDSKDEGLILKNFGETGWGLFNLRNSEVIMHNEVVKAIGPPRELKDDAFSNMLAEVVNDSTIREKDLAVAMDEKPVSSVTDTSMIAVTPITSDSTTNSTIPITTPPSTGIQKQLQKLGTDGLDLVYVDVSGNKTDTIRLFVPANKDEIANAPVVVNPDQPVKKNAADSATQNVTNDDNQPATISAKQEKKEKKKSISQLENNEPKFIEDKPVEKKSKKKKTKDIAADTTITAANDVADTLAVKTNVTNVALSTDSTTTDNKTSKKERRKRLKEVEAKTDTTIALNNEVDKSVAVNDKITDNKEPVASDSTSKPDSPAMINSDCKKLANDDDYMKLRKKLAGSEDNSAMMEIARKTFKTRCFTTQQIKRLSVLFVNDEGRYQFFDAAYPFLYDTDNVKQLESQLSDPHYINRFRAMIKK